MNTNVRLSKYLGWILVGCAFALATPIQAEKIYSYDSKVARESRGYGVFSRTRFPAVNTDGVKHASGATLNGNRILLLNSRYSVGEVRRDSRSSNSQDSGLPDGNFVEEPRLRVVRRGPLEPITPVRFGDPKIRSTTDKLNRQRRSRSSGSSKGLLRAIFGR